MKTTTAKLVLLGVLATLCAAQQKNSATSTPVAHNQSKPTTMDAWISDEKCGAAIDPDCAKKCAREGSKLVVVNLPEKSVIPVANQSSIKAFVGQHVTVKGTLENGVLTVSSVTPVK